MKHTEPTKYTGTLNAFITNPWTTLATLAQEENPLNLLAYTASEMTYAEDWTKIGTAEITVTLFDEKKIVAGMVESIDTQIQSTYAEAELKIKELKQKRQELLAITMDVKASQ